MSSTALRKKRKPTTSLTLHDILLDIGKMPDMIAKDEESSIPIESVSVDTLPTSSQSVHSSLILSRTFIESNKRVLADAELVDSIRDRLDHIDKSLKEVEQIVTST